MRDRLEAVRGRIDRAARRAGRDPGEVCIVAVTKGHPASAVRAAVAAGLGDIGENRVQEARAKQRRLTPEVVRWHLLGHLQHNKAAAATRLFDTVHSIDSIRIAGALAGHRNASTPLNVLVEIDLTGRVARTGAAPAQADDLVAAVAALPALRLLGLMTIAPPGPAEAARGCFARLHELRDQLRARHGLPLAELSMGMSDDFEAAVEEGATIVRLGRILFGDRPQLS